MTEFEQKQIEQLERIGNALECIDSELETLSTSISNIVDCVGYVPPMHGYAHSNGYNFLRIGGSVDTD